MKKLLLLLLISLPVLGFCAKLNITLSKNSLDLNSKDSIVYKFYLPSGAKTNIRFINIYGGEEIAFESGKDRAKGWHEVIVKSDSISKKLSSGLYYVDISGNFTTGESIRFHSFQDPWGNFVMVKDPEFDKSLGIISYYLPRYSMVRIRIGLQNGGLFRTYNWQPQDAGENTFVWDGFDQTGTTKVLGKLEASLKIVAFELPTTAFYLENRKTPINRVASPSLPEGWDKFAISDLGKESIKNSYDAAMNVNIVTNKTKDQIIVTFPEKTGNLAELTKLFRPDNEIYVSIDGEVYVETPNIDMLTNIPLSIPPLKSGSHLFITNIIFGNETDPNSSIAIGINEIIVP